MTSIGSNFDGHFSIDGKRVLFLSSGRPSHSQVQVYEKDLTTGRERRVTFHDGDTNSPRYDIKGARMFYASTTDELKENPVFLQRRLDAGKAGPEPLKRNQWETLPTDIYVSGLNGDNIERLTHSRGFDGDISVHPKTGTLYFSSNQTGYLQIHVLDPRNGSARLLSKEATLNEAEAAVAPDGKTLAWVQYAPDLSSSQIILGSLGKAEKPFTLTQGSSFHLSPAWTPNGEEIVFSANADGSENYDLYIIKRDGSCLRRLTTTSAAQESKPSISPDGRQLLFSSNESGSSQLYLVSFQPPSTCPGPQ